MLLVILIIVLLLLYNAAVNATTTTTTTTDEWYMLLLLLQLLLLMMIWWCCCNMWWWWWCCCCCCSCWSLMLIILLPAAATAVQPTWDGLIFIFTSANNPSEMGHELHLIPCSGETYGPFRFDVWHKASLSYKQSMVSIWHTLYHHAPCKSSAQFLSSLSLSLSNVDHGIPSCKVVIESPGKNICVGMALVKNIIMTVCT